MADAQPRETESFTQNEERFRLLVEGVSDYAIFMLDPDGIITSWNSGAERIKGYKPDEIIGKHFSIFYTKEQTDREFPAYELKVARAEGRFEDEGWRVRKDGARFWANVVITALYNRDGSFLGFAKVTRDMTERRAHEETLRRSEERFRLIVEGVVDYAIFMLDPTGHVASWNTGAERIKGYRVDEIIGKHFSIFYPKEQADSGFPDFELETTRAVGRFEDEGWRVRKDGSRFWANVVITALHDSDGNLYGFAKVTRDMTERKRIEALELAEKQMFEFLAMLSHELRNPIAPISNAVYMLRLMQIDDPELRWIRDVIDRQVFQLTRIVDDLLEASRVTHGNIRLQRERVDLMNVVTRALESSRPLMDQRRHIVNISMPSSPTMVYGDLTRLTQVVVNILNNAAKYTPEGGRIDVSLSAHAGNGVVSVRDNGVGIAKEFLPKIFDLFAQGERTLDRADGGLGIGLTLVRVLVEMHGGTVEVASDGAGTGSEFTVRIPLRASDGGATTSSDDATPAAQENVKTTRVLIVDDNVDAATSMMLFVRMWGYDVRVAHDGSSAVDLALEYRPDIVLLDIGLPKLDGYEVVARLRGMPEMKNVVVVAVTGYGQEAERIRATDAGFNHHFVKPVEPHKLRALLETILANRE